MIKINLINLGFKEPNKCKTELEYYEKLRERRKISLSNNEPIPSVIETSTNNCALSYHYENGKYLPYKYWYNDKATEKDIQSIFKYIKNNFNL